MNLRQYTAGVVPAINPLVPVVWKASNGTTQVGSKLVPAYAAPVTIQGQIQALTYSDLRQIDALNLQGTRYGVYLMGSVNGVIRATSKGGDLLTFPDGKVYLVAQNLEQWPDWCKVVATLQNGA